MTSYRADKPNFQESWVKMAKMTVTSYRADKVQFTDGRTDRWTDRRADAGNNNTHSAWKGKG